jgi:Xaa-Pro aminopeptidase
MADNKALMHRVTTLRELMGKRGYDAVIIRNNPDLRWLTGAQRTFDFEAAHTAFITADKLWLHTDSRYFGTFQKRLGEDSLWQLDEDLVDGPTWAAARVAETGAHIVAVEDTLDLAFFDAFEQACAKASLVCLMPHLHGDIAVRMRAAKDEEELRLMREAQRITDDAFRHIIEFMHAGQSELQVRVELENYMLTHGAEELSFATIIAAGPNGANPHAQPSDYVLKDGDMVVMDYGACFHDYHADMTRTVCVGSPNDKQRHVYDVVQKTNETCAAAIHAGVVGKDIHALAVHLISEAGYGDYFKHGLGHGVGLEIHERPRFSRTSEDVLMNGAVITDEPGIYLPGNFGVRVEDCGVVDEEGYHPFSKIGHELVCVGR